METDRVFHLSQIKKICIDYRLRFLDTKFFKGDYPYEVMSKINKLESEHNIKLEGFKIVAPSKLFVLKKADDPLLFVPISNGYYYLIHKWGRDLYPLRKHLMWPFKNISNLAITIVAFSFLFSLFSENFVFNNKSNITYFLILFLFVFKSFVGVILFYGVASGKNFNEFIPFKL